MKHKHYSKHLLSLLALAAFTGPARADDAIEKRILWSDKPVVFDQRQAENMRYAAEHWSKNVFPLGNGRLGCTVFGDPKKERIQFNEDSLWVGNEDCTGGYQPFGDLYIEMPHTEFSNYRRELDISSAVQTVTYTSGGVNYKREYFSSHPAQVMAYRFTADKKGSLTGKVTIGNLHEIPTTTEGKTLTMKGHTEPFFWWQLQVKQPKRLLGGREYASDKIIDLDFEAQARVINEGGTVKTVGDAVVFENCDSLTILLAADTNYINQRDKGWRTDHPHARICAQLAAAEPRGFDALLKEHVTDYQRLYGRLAINLGKTLKSITDLPTSQRVKTYQEQFKAKGIAEDRDLEVLIYQYARYLMLSCSRPGEGALPANLQGLWLYELRPAWRCDYHTDINVQMNYWFTDQANVAECFIPLAEWVDSIRDVRKEETQKVLGVKRGWLMRSENNIFGGSTYFFQKGDSAWISQNIWDHYAFTQDKEYLKRYAYPVMKEISEFWVDHLKELPDGTLVVPDGRSPEHGPEKSDAVSYDQQLCWDLFSNTIEASMALDVDAAYRDELIAKQKKLLGPKIGKWGQLQEWMEDIDDPKNDHRHISHMMAVFPGHQIHPTVTPELAAAAKISTLARGPGPTGWSKIFRSCVLARLLDAENAYKRLSEVIAEKTADNLWMTHPPFQIDANFGFAAATNEMLAQSHMGFIHLLPALPKAWPQGHVKGMRVRGGFEIDMQWDKGSLVHAEIRNVSGTEAKCEIRNANGTVKLSLPASGTRALQPTDFK
ncbi:MAG: glycoside hydrolase N-terminal domain-containing protein [Verrucomicrobiota bacterium]